MTVSTTCPGDLLELEGRSPSGDLSQQPVREAYWSWREGVRVETCLNSLSWRPTGAGGKESKGRLSQQPVWETYMELEGRSPSGDGLNKLNGSMELEGGTPEFKLMQMEERRQRLINTVTHLYSTQSE